MTESHIRINAITKAIFIINDRLDTNFRICKNKIGDYYDTYSWMYITLRNTQDAKFISGWVFITCNSTLNNICGQIVTILIRHNILKISLKINKTKCITNE